MNPYPSSNRRIAVVEQAIDLHGSFLRSYILSLTKNHHDAEELFDDLWLFVLRRFPEEDIGKIGFLKRKAYQLFVDAWRRRSRNPVSAVETVPDVAVTGDQFEPVDERDEAGFRARFFEEYPVVLTAEQQEALWLHARIGLTFREIGESMGKPASTVGDWIKQAREAFADYLNNEENART